MDALYNRFNEVFRFLNERLSTRSMDYSSIRYQSTFRTVLFAFILLDLLVGAESGGELPRALVVGTVVLNILYVCLSSWQWHKSEQESPDVFRIEKFSFHVDIPLLALNLFVFAPELYYLLGILVLVPTVHGQRFGGLVLLSGVIQAFVILVGLGELSPFWADQSLALIMMGTLLFVMPMSQFTAAQQMLQLTSRMEADIYSDALTGIGNRKFLLNELKNRLMLEKPFSICFIDLDNFKEVNDKYGHEVGDQVLRKFGRNLSTAFRDNDCVGRVAGDEFIVICQGDPPEDMLFQRISGSCRRVNSEMEREHELATRIQASVGALAVEPCKIHNRNLLDFSVARMMKQADRLMYQIKGQNKNGIRLERFQVKPTENKETEAECA